MDPGQRLGTAFNIMKEMIQFAGKGTRILPGLDLRAPAMGKPAHHFQFLASPFAPPEQGLAPHNGPYQGMDSGFGRPPHET